MGARGSHWRQLPLAQPRAKRLRRDPAAAAPKGQPGTRHTLGAQALSHDSFLDTPFSA